MKANARVLIVVAIITVMALSVWGGALAEKGSTGANPNMLVSRLFQRENSMEPETETPQSAEVMQNQPADDQAEIATSPEAGDDNQMSHESTGTPEAGDDSQLKQESAAGVVSDSEITGVVASIDGTTVTVDGKVFNLPSTTEGLSSAHVGDTVKLQFTTNPDGSVSVREIKIAEQVNGPDDSSNSANDSSSNSSKDASGPDDSGGHHGGSGDGGGSGGGDGGSGG